MSSPSAASVRRLLSVIRQTRDPVFLTDPQGRLVFVNAACEALTGLQADPLRDPGTENVASSDHEAVTRGLTPPPEVLEGHPGGGIVLLTDREGQAARRRIAFWPFLDEKGQLIGVMGTLRDISIDAQFEQSPSLRAITELAEIRLSLRDRHGHDALIGRGPRHDRLMEQIRTASLSDAPVLLLGESGSGRSLAARTIHRLRGRGGEPLIPLDVPAISPEILERALFEPATSTDSPAATWILRELLDVPRDLQARIAQRLADRSLILMGTTTESPDSARVRGALRDDFFYALTAMVIPLAPLRDRIDEIPLLATHFLDQASARTGRRASGFSPGALEVLQGYDWPGNLGELGRVVLAAHQVRAEGLIQEDDLPAMIRGALAGAYVPPPTPPAITPLDPWLTQMERSMIERALQMARQNKSRAADLLGISRPRLYRRIKELNIPEQDEPAGS